MIHGLLSAGMIAFRCTIHGNEIRSGLVLVEKPVNNGEPRIFAHYDSGARFPAVVLTPDGKPLQPGQAHYEVVLRLKDAD